jgi:hypothetical protein
MRAKLFIVLLLTLLLNLYIVSAWDWSASQSFDCDGCCVEDKTFQYETTLTNTGSNTFYVDEVRLKKSSGSTIASKTTGYYISSGNSRSFTLTGNIPEPNGNYLYYYVCFHLSEERDHWLWGTYTYTDWSCSGTQTKQVTPKENFKCFTDNNCPASQYCYISGSCTSECKDVSQGSCGHIVDHEWVNYECCSNSDCTTDKSCSNHYCVDISCSCGYVSNHQCIEYECCSDSDCDYGYYCSEHNCLKYQCMENADCANNEYCSNHNCISLNCGYCEHIVNHNCIKYDCCKDSECNNNQKCHEHLCEDLKCEYGYYASDHDCKKHECMVNNDCDDWEECKTNKCVAVKCQSDKIIMYHSCEEVKNIQKVLGYVKDNRYISFFTKESFNDHKIIYISIFSLLLISIIGLAYFLTRKKSKSKHHKKIEVKKEEPKKEVKSSKKKFCNKCGHKVKGKEKYCRKCGNKL